MSSSLRILITTFFDRETAIAVIRSLVEEKLVACGTLFPDAYSIYHWKGSLEETSEVVVWMKTSLSLLEACQERLAALHPYDVPEIIVIEADRVNRAYQAWIEESLN